MFTGFSSLSAQTGELRVEVVGIKHGEGQIGVSVFSAAEGFPGKHEKALYNTVVPSAEGTVTVTFPDVPAGRYAISVMHDENGNTSLDTNLFGIPKEGWSVSNNVPARFGPPKFDEAVVSFQPGNPPIRITMRY